MSAALIAACLWAIAATVTAFLPMRLQFPPGIAAADPRAGPACVDRVRPGVLGGGHCVIWLSVDVPQAADLFRAQADQG
jgi:hypothetical protein